MSEKRFYLDEEDRLCIHYDGEILASVGFKETEAIKIVDMLNLLNDENGQLRILLKEAEDEIELLKKSNQGFIESTVENDSNKEFVSRFLSNLRDNGFCEGCKNKDKPVEWYIERGLSITAGVCDRYEPED